MCFVRCVGGAATSQKLGMSILFPSLPPSYPTFSSFLSLPFFAFLGTWSLGAGGPLWSPNVSVHFDVKNRPLVSDDTGGCWTGDELQLQVTRYTKILGCRTPQPEFLHTRPIEMCIFHAYCNELAYLLSTLIIISCESCRLQWLV